MAVQRMGTRRVAGVTRLEWLCGCIRLVTRAYWYKRQKLDMHYLLELTELFDTCDKVVKMLNLCTLSSVLHWFCISLQQRKG